MRAIEDLDATTVQRFTAAETAVLILAKTSCDGCVRWTSELEAELATGAAFPGVRFGKLHLDQSGLGGFKRANPWLADVTHLPHTVIYRCGERVRGFVGGGVDRLRAQLARVGRP